MSRIVTVADVQTWNSKVFGLLMWTAGIVASSFRRRTDTSSLEHWKWNRERSLKPSNWKKKNLILLTSAKVSASVKPACATPSLSWSESLFTGNYGDNSQLPRQLENHTHPSPPRPVWRHMKSWAASWWCCWSRRQWPRLPLCHIHEERLWNKKILFHRTSWKYNQKLV